MRMARASGDKVTRIVLLSDGEATVGVQDLGGFKRIAEGCRNSDTQGHLGPMISFSS